MNNIYSNKKTVIKSSVILISKNIPCLYTLKKIVEKKCNIKAVIICEKKGLSTRFKKEYKSIIRYGLYKRVSQILLFIYFVLFKSKSEKKYLNECYNNLSFDEILSILNKKKIEIFVTSDYATIETLKFLKLKNPDFLVSHTPYWIGKKVREISKEKKVIGSHPGFVPFYRGAHSAFWSKFNGEKHLNGYSIFLLDKGIDSGPIISQKKLPYNEEISYKCNDYLLMKSCSEEHANIVEKYSNGEEINSQQQQKLNSSQIYRSPGIIEYLKFIN